MDNPTRRRALAAGLAGTALGLIGGRTASAGATSPARRRAAGAPPAQPTEADLELLAFAQSIELAARDLYQTAVDARADDPTIVLMRDNHQAYADVLAGVLGTSATGRRDDDLFDDLQEAFDVGDVAAAAAAGFNLESTLVATHTDLLRSLEGIDGSAVVASILVVEARNCTVLADLSGGGADLDALFVNDAAPLAANR